MLARDLAGDALHAPGHFIGGTAREGQQQDAPGIGSPGKQMRHPVGEGIGLARPGAGNDQKRSVGIAWSAAPGCRIQLVIVETRKVIGRGNSGGVGHGTRSATGASQAGRAESARPGISGKGAGQRAGSRIGSSHSRQIRKSVSGLEARSISHGSTGLWQRGQMMRDGMAELSNTVIIYSYRESASPGRGILADHARILPPGSIRPVARGVPASLRRCELDKPFFQSQIESC